MVKQLARQVTDLAAAGANLFHAVVELQRLRASSERKFQRWFFETRSVQERSQELLAMAEASLAEERKRVDQLQKRYEELEHAQQMTQKALDVETTRRSWFQNSLEEAEAELRIAKTEARRAWEELGRREEERVTMIERLQEGEPTTMERLTLVPMMPKSGHGESPSTVSLCQLLWK